jgi:hypothetical protein
MVLAHSGWLKVGKVNPEKSSSNALGMSCTAGAQLWFKVIQSMRKMGNEPHTDLKFLWLYSVI